MGFAVTRTSKSMVSPTPAPAGGTLPLSALDRVPGLRHLVLSLHVFNGSPSVGESPSRVVREALGKTLVDYYPLAGRFVEAADGEVRVACTGEGAWFVEATAACTLEEVKHLDRPMVIPKEELLPEPAPDVPPLDMPLMMQVTEFRCGGFVVGLMSVHTMTDGLGAGQFINAVADYARGLPKPRVSPVWARDVLPNPPRMPAPPPTLEQHVLRGLIVDFSPDHIAKVKADFFASTGGSCSTFDVCVAKTWQSRTRALLLAGAGGNFNDDSPVHVRIAVNARHLMLAGANAGFYGNCLYPLRMTCRSGEVAAGEVVDLVRVVRDAKARLAGEVARWTVGGFAHDPYELRLSYDTLFFSDWRHLGFLEADYGWGTPVHVAPFCHPFMPAVLISAPPVPKVGVRVTTMCVEEAHLLEFMNQMNR